MHQMAAIKDNSKTARIVIIGGGIVGSALAFYLSTKASNAEIILLDPSLETLQGSTAIAPGLVGQLNEINHLTRVAKESVVAYTSIPGAFQRVGGLEIAEKKEGIERLRHRQGLAHQAELRAEILTSEEIAELAPDFHAKDNESVGLFFPDDGTVEPTKLVEYYRAEATARGVIFAAERVVNFQHASSSHYHITTDSRLLTADTVTLATGIWTSGFLRPFGIEVPIIPVGHSYAYGPNREKREKGQPFVRWPEHHVYARDHGERDGFGTYDHVPITCEPGQSALGELLARYVVQKE